MSLDELLNNIEVRPSMYLGTRSISCLKAFIDGWILAMGNRADEARFLYDFQEWLQEKYDITSTQSWAKIILFFSQDETDALDNFFLLLNEYRKKYGG